MADPLIDDLSLPDGQDALPGSDPVPVPVSPVVAEPSADPGASRHPDRDPHVQRVQAAALVILAAAAVLSLMYIAKLILVVILLAVLLSFVLAPVVDALTDLRVPRAVGAFVSVALMVVALGVVSYVSYARALDFMSQMPEYRTRLQRILNEVRERAEQLEKNAETVLPSEPEEKGSVTVRERNSLRNLIS